MMIDKKRSAKQSQDPSQQKGNVRTALALAVMLAIGGTALATRDSEPKAPKVTFETNDQAQARLGDLVHVYGNDSYVSEGEGRDIKDALGAAIPVFKAHVAERVAALQQPQLQNRTFKQDRDKLGYARNYEVHSSIQKNGDRTDVITSTGAIGTNTTTSEYLYVFHKANGSTDILYGVSNTDVNFSSRDKVSMTGAKIEVFQSTDLDGNPENSKGNLISLVTFDGGFDGSVLETAGSKLKYVTDGMQKVEDFLARADEVVHVPTAS